MSSTPGTPRRLGPYELVSPLGAGGMGEVWRAVDSRLGRSVAVKVIASGLAHDDQIRARMQREARSVSALNHPNICSLFDIGHDDGSDYLVMELVEGDTLAERLLAGPLPVDRIVAVASQVVQAMEEAHSHGVTHRDLKPANIMLTSRGLVKVLDFGLATRSRTEQPDGDHTLVKSSAGMMIGTLAYMSPEQANGAQADERSDIFSIGVILYEMATGVRPFDGTPAQVAAQLLAGQARPLRSINPDLPVALERLVAKCMATDPSLRYQSAAALLADLQSVTAPPRQARASREAVPKRVAKKVKEESVAVLPFVNATGDPQLDYLSDGIAEGVLHALSKSSGLRVLARSTTFRYRNALDPAAVGRELKVRTVLTGEVSVRRGAVAVSAELLDARKGAHLWGSVYPDAEAQAVQSEIAREAAATLNVRDAVRGARAAVDDEAYRQYLRGRHSLNKGTSQSLHSAIQAFQQSIDRDPAFALGFAGLADAYLMYEAFTQVRAGGVLSKARAAAARALQLDESVAEACTSLAMVDFQEWNWTAAEAGFLRAMALNPNYQVAPHWYSMYLITRERLEEALRYAERAREIDPLSATIAVHVSATKLMTGRVAEGVHELRRLGEVETGVPMIHQWLAHGYLLAGDNELAIAEFEKEVEVSGNGPLALAALGFGLSRVGRADEARGIVNTLLQRFGGGEVQPMWIAGVYAGLRETEHAFGWLETAVQAERSATTTYITWPPWFDELKSEPRYIELLRLMGLR